MKTQKNNRKESDLPTGLSQPALRALANAGIKHLEQLAKFTEKDVKNFHGIGPNALNKLRQALAERGLSFREVK